MQTNISHPRNASLHMACISWSVLFRVLTIMLLTVLIQKAQGALRMLNKIPLCQTDAVTSNGRCAEKDQVGFVKPGRPWYACCNP